ncbi:MAG: hypothetical protein ACPG7F_17615, partial [Aggregatilineales bacterium]
PFQQWVERYMGQKQYQTLIKTIYREISKEAERGGSQIFKISGVIDEKEMDIWEKAAYFVLRGRFSS